LLRVNELATHAKKANKNAAHLFFADIRANARKPKEFEFLARLRRYRK
jgi:hypothetical protein